MTIVAIALGGAIGAVMRYLVSVRAYGILGIGLPYGTLTVNVLGAFLLGVILGLVERGAFGPQARSFLVIGLLGSMTTFSAFTYESWELLRDGDLFAGLLNVGLSLFGALAAFIAGEALVRTAGG